MTTAPVAALRSRTLRLGLVLSCAALLPAPCSAGCDQGSYDAAYAACNADPPGPQCAPVYNEMRSACESDLQKAIAAVDKSKPADRDAAVEALSDLRMKIYYDMGGFKSYGILGSSGKHITVGGESFNTYANEAWERAEKTFDDHGYEVSDDGEILAGPGDGEEAGDPAADQKPGAAGKPRSGAQGEAQPRKERVEALLDQGKAAEAEDLLDELLQDDPENPELLAMRSVARLNQEDKSGALSDAKASLKSDPENKTAQEVKDFIELTGRAAGVSLKLKGPKWESKDMGSRFDGSGGDGAAGAGGKLMAGGGWRSGGPSRASGGGYDAVDAGGSGWSATGSGPGAGAYAPGAQATLPMSQGLTGSQVLVREARKKLRLGDLSGAFLEAARALQADARNPAAWTTRAAVSNKLKNFDAAIGDATEALKLEPKNVPAMLERGYAQYNMGNLTAALEDIGSAIKIEPMNALAYLYRGMIFEKMTRYTEALADYETAARLDPTLRQFWEDAKTRLLGGGKGKGKTGPGARRPGRGLFWLIPSGLSLLILVIFIRRRLKERAQPAAEPEPPAGAEPGQPKDES
ncbi:MAG: tetratricopeptide repeat protein [Elusimicrobia bacterium]|nr:tetratricopeptide repeat protein [Elusimicrobiota bacterium]